jgi:hypothetical protein
MFLFDVVAFNAENTASVKVARRLTQTIRAMKMNLSVLGGDFDIFIAMSYGPSILVLRKSLIEQVVFRLQDFDSRGQTTSIVGRYIRYVIFLLA